MSFLTPPSRRRARSRPGSRFQRVRRPREEFAGRLVQAVVMSGLALALAWLLVVTGRLVQSRLVEKYGSQAWLLPITIGFVFLFILYRLQRLWAEVVERAVELRQISKSSDNNEKENDT
jgi:sterol desaturase/sphingolipid hydroxylase (fatty acid hydroxylase superfamily)